jgi:hypothetical protein
MRRTHRTGSLRWLAGLLAGLLTACAVAPPAAPPDADVNASAWVQQTRLGPAGGAVVWTHQTFGDRKPTQYRPVTLAGRPAVHAHSAGGNSTLRAVLAPWPDQRAARLRFAWFVPRLNEQADLRDRDVDDAVARVILTFDGDRDARFAPRDHLLSELARLITGEPLPYATLMYVWDNRYPAGTLISNPHSDRIRQLVVESGPGRLGQWVDIERDVAADFRHAFGEAPGPLHSVGVMSDANNTGATVDAWYGPVQLYLVPASADSTRDPPMDRAALTPAAQR